MLYFFCCFCFCENHKNHDMLYLLVPIALKIVEIHFFIFNFSFRTDFRFLKH